MKNLLSILLITLISFNKLYSQSIVNTEKLFKDSDEAFRLSSELMGSYICGNADISLIEYSLNFAFKHKQNYFRLLMGGENIQQNKEPISNSIFTQFRYNYFLNDKNRLIAFSQIQSNSVLLLKQQFYMELDLEKDFLQLARIIILS